MNNYLSFNKIKGETFDEAIEMIKKGKSPKTWNEMEAEGIRGHTGAVRHYKEAAERAKENPNYRGLYFFIKKANEFLYIGRKNHNILGRLGNHKWDKDKRECHIAIVDFSRDISFQHLKFYEAVFIVLCQPTQNKQGTGAHYHDTFEFLRNKKLTIDETYIMRTYHKP